MTKEAPVRATLHSIAERLRSTEAPIQTLDPTFSWSPDGPQAPAQAPAASPPPPQLGEEARILPWTIRKQVGYGSAFSRVLEGIHKQARELFEDQAHAGSLCDELLAAPTRERRQVMVKNTRRYHRIAVCERLLDRSLRLVLDDALSAREIAELARELSEEINPVAAHRGLLEDTRARAWAAIGNADRALGFLAASALAFRRAHGHLVRGTGNPLEEASVLELEALLLARLGHFDRAEAAVDRQARLGKRFDEPQHLRRSLLHRASLSARRSDFAAAARICQSWLEQFAGEVEPDLTLVARGGFVAFLDLAGMPLEPRRLLGSLDPRRTGREGGWRAGLGLWLAGRTLSQQPDCRPARQAWEGALATFSGYGHWHEAARTAVDLLGLGTLRADQDTLRAGVEGLAALCANPEVTGPLRSLLEELCQGDLESLSDRLDAARRELALLQCDPEVFVIRNL